ncbi:unnamed protein product [Alternaria alternata]
MSFPSSSTQCRDFAALLAEKDHTPAPDLPDFGLTEVATNFGYTFDNIGIVVSAWPRKVNVTTCAMYIFDYRAPVGLRLTLEQPLAVNAIVTQNGDAYDVGFGQDFCAPIFDLLRTENRPQAWEVLRNTVLTKDPIMY